MYTLARRCALHCKQQTEIGKPVECEPITPIFWIWSSTIKQKIPPLVLIYRYSSHLNVYHAVSFYLLSAKHFQHVQHTCMKNTQQLSQHKSLHFVFAMKPIISTHVECPRVSPRYTTMRNPRAHSIALHELL
jgi:hypothetical protein